MTTLRLKRLFLFYQFVILFNLLSLSGCASTGGYISGQVLDADTLEPIPDVHVIINWEGSEFALVDTQTVCVHADGTLTDENGKYRFLPWIRPDRYPVGTVGSKIYVYKPGYEEVKPRRKPKDDPYLLKHVEVPRKERFEYLSHIPQRTSCHEGGESQKNIFPLYEAMYYEAKVLAVSGEEKKKLEWFREVAASAAISDDNENEMTLTEYNNLINEFLKDNLQ